MALPAALVPRTAAEVDTAKTDKANRPSSRKLRPRSPLRPEGVMDEIIHEKNLDLSAGF
jgi:hypothetical protein